MGIDLITHRTGNASKIIIGSRSSAETCVEAKTQTDRVPESCESSFLLDWLAGGEACQRNIQGFSFKFETLNVVVARFRRSLLETRTLTNSNDSEVVPLRTYLSGNQR